LVVSRKLRPHHLASSNEVAILIGALSAVAAILAHSTIDFNLHIPANTIFVAFLFGILACPISDPAVVPENEYPSREWLRALAPLTALPFITFAVMFVPGEYHGERSRLALRDRHFPAALELAEKSLALDNTNPDVFYYHGEAQHYLALESNDPAIRLRLHTNAANSFERGLKLFPQDLRLMLKIGRTLDNLGRFSEAEAHFERALRADPNFGNVYAYFGVHCHLQRRFKKAENLYMKAQELGEREVSAVGLADLVRDRKLAADDVFAELIGDPEMEEED
jgi:tetratricopeptide (TPR) repeat protein